MRRIGLILAAVLTWCAMASAQVQISAYAAPVCDDGVGGDCFDIVVDLTNVGDGSTDSCIDMNDDGLIDLRRLTMFHKLFSITPADGEYMRYYSTGDTLGWDTPAGGGYDWLDSAAANAGWGLETTVDGDDSLRVKASDLDQRYFTQGQVQAEIGDSNAEYLTREQFKDSLDAAAYLDSSNLANQGVVPDDIDTTDNKFVFSDVYRGLSSDAESVFVTIETIEDTATLCGRHAGQVWTGVHDYGGATSLEIPNAANPTTDAEGEFAWDTDDNAIEVFDGDSSVLIGTRHPFVSLIMVPDSVQAISDYVPVLPVEPSWAPHGITIIALGVKWSKDLTATVNFEEWDYPMHGSPATIDAVSVSAATEHTETTITDPDVAVGSTICVDLPTGTTAAFLQVWGVFVIKDGN